MVGAMKNEDKVKQICKYSGEEEIQNTKHKNENQRLKEEYMRKLGLVLYIKFNVSVV